MSPSRKIQFQIPDALKQLFVQSLSRGGGTHVSIGVIILLLDVLCSAYLLFPILFVIPVVATAWFCSRRLACWLAVVLPFGRVLTAEFVHHATPLPYILINFLIRVIVLLFLAILVSRVARQSQELKKRLETFVKVCAWSKTVEYDGEWISFEEYLQRRFNVKTSHGISPVEYEKIIKSISETKVK